MAPLPSISDFVSFRELQVRSPSDGQKCIWYLTAEERRCGQPLNKVDRKNAFELRTLISCSTPDEVSLEQLKQYASLKCCNHQHRLQLTRNYLVEPLARKWQQELSAESNSQHIEALPSPPASSQLNTSHEQDAHSQGTAGIIQTRSRAHQGSQIEATALQTSSIDSVSPAFRPCKESGAKSVSDKLSTQFKSSDSGSIYIYTRASSPGYVKIGYAFSVQDRLKTWQRKCGYEPILVAAFHDVPLMRKVESLVHHQLADFWRKEQRCKTCDVEHQEWFEIEKEDAVKVVGQWTEWMKKAEPYYAQGNLKGVWVDELERLKNRGISVTAEVLLSSYARLFGTESATVEDVGKDDNTTTNTTHSSLVAEDLTSESEMQSHQVQDLSNLMIGTLKIVHGFGRSLQRAGQVLMAVDAYQRAAIDQRHHMDSIPTRLGRQDTNATIASVA